MRQRVTPTKRAFARGMRVQATDAETRLWLHLRNGRLAGLKFRRQVPIGGAIVDFICYERKLVIEVDGGQHSGSERDGLRSADLARRGFRVLRFWNNDVLGNVEAVLQGIAEAAGIAGPLTPRT